MLPLISKRLAVAGLLAPLVACGAKGPRSTLIAFGSRSEIWVVNPSGTHPRRIVSGRRYGPQPLVWSPDGSTLVYRKHSLVGWDLWAIDVSSGGTRNLTKVRTGGCRSASFSPDGKRIAFLRDWPRGVYLMNADGSDQRRLTNLGHRGEAPSWAPDSNRLVFCHLGEVDGKPGTTLHLVDVQLGRITPLVGKLCRGSEASWRPHGSEVVFVRSTNDNHDLWLCNVDAGTERRLTHSVGQESTPVWSPDGEWIAYVLRNGESLSLMVCAPDGSDQRVVAKVEGSTCAPSWSPSSDRIAFCAVKSGGAPEVLTVRLDGSDRRWIAAGRFCAWQRR